MNKKQKKLIEIAIIILAILMFFVFIFSNILIKHVNDLDELWNYNTARQIMNGLVPYKDISMITTPFLPSLVGLILKLTTDELIVSRALTAILATAILFLTYKIFKRLVKNKVISFILVGLITAIYYNYFVLDYNFFVLFLTLIIVWLELKMAEDEDITISKTNIKYNIIIGMIAGIAICTKHTIGAFVTLGTLIVQLFFVKDKNSFRVYIKNTTIKLLGIIIPAIIFIIYMFVTNSFNDFINYAIQGIKTFSNSIPYHNLIKGDDIIVGTLAFVIPVLLILIVGTLIANNRLKRKLIIENVDIKRLIILTVFSIAMLIVIYPIADKIHFLIANYIALITSIYFICYLVKEHSGNKNLNKKKYIAITLKSFFIMLIIVELGLNTYRNLKEYIEDNKNNKLSHFQNLIIDEYLINRIDEVNEYRKEKEDVNVIILDAEAVAIDIVQDIYYKNYDMFLKGNIGKDAEDGIIENIKESHNCIYLIKREGLPLNWQTPTKAIDYVRENLQKIDDVNIFEAYYKY